jgi:ribosome-interacting GTPase 1
VTLIRQTHRLFTAQKNKATSYHLGQLKAKLAKLRRELISPSSGSGGGAAGLGFDVARTGIASVGYVRHVLLLPQAEMTQHQLRRISISWKSQQQQPLRAADGSHNLVQSTLMSKLTGTHSEVSEIEFTTLTTVPGTVKVHGAPIQILDLRTPRLQHNRSLSDDAVQPGLSRVRRTDEVVVDKVCALSRSITAVIDG